MSFRKIIFFIFFSSTLILSLVLSQIYRVHEKKESNEELTFYKNQIQEQSKQLVKDKVLAAITLIETDRKQMHQLNTDSVKSHVLHLLENMHFKNGGYVFVNTGDGQALLFDGHIVHGQKDITNMTDPQGKRLFDLELEAVSKPEGDFIYYKFKRMNDTAQVDKVSFVKLYPEWGWLIGAGIYLPDINKEIELIQHNSEVDNATDIKRSLYLFAIIVICSFILSFWVSKIIQEEFDMLRDDIEDAVLSLNLLDDKSYKINNFKKLALTINGFINRKQLVNDRVKEAHKLLESVFSASRHVGFFVTNLNGADTVIQYVNDGAAQMMGIPKDKLIGRKLSEFHSSDFKEKVEKFFALMLNNKSGVEQEIEIKRNTGSPMHINIVLYPRYDDKGEISGGLFVFTDITNLKTMENELRQYQGELQEMVDERTVKLEQKAAELENKNKELSYLNDLFVGREFRIKELKTKIKELEEKLRITLDKQEE